MIKVAPDREVGLNCAPSSTTGKDSNSHKTSRESLPPSPPPGLSPLHFGRFTISFNSKISYVWSRAGYDLHGVHGRNEGDEKKKKLDNDKSRCRVLQRHRGQFSSALKRCFTTWIRTGKEESMADELSENMSIDNDGDTVFGSFGKV